MNSKRTPWSYRKGNTPLHRLPAGPKLAFLLLLSVAAFFPGPEPLGVVILAGIALILAALSLTARIAPWQLLRGSGPLFFVILGVFLVQGIELIPPGIKLGGLKETAIFSLRIATAFSAGSLLFSVTTTSEIRRALSRLETFLHLKKLHLSLCISLMMGFLKGFFVIWEDLTLAWKSRGGKKNLSRLITLIPLVIERMMLKAAETALALEARNFT